MDFVRFTMRNPHLFQSTAESRCIIASECGAGGNVFTFIMEYENYSFVEAFKMLAERAGVDIPEVELF